MRSKGCVTEPLHPQIAQPTTPASLVDHPQRLGILPTWRFWNSPENGRLVARWFGALGALLVLATIALGLHPVIGGIAAGGSWVLAVGLFEKYIRRQARRRRAMLPVDGQD
jgi:hypothetical protein